MSQWFLLFAAVFVSNACASYAVAEQHVSLKDCMHAAAHAPKEVRVVPITPSQQCQPQDCISNAGGRAYKRRCVPNREDLPYSLGVTFLYDSADTQCAGHPLRVVSERVGACVSGRKIMCTVDDWEIHQYNSAKTCPGAASTVQRIALGQCVRRGDFNAVHRCATTV